MSDVERMRNGRIVKSGPEVEQWIWEFLTTHIGTVQWRGAGSVGSPVGLLASCLIALFFALVWVLRGEVGGGRRDGRMEAFFTGLFYVLASVYGVVHVL